MPQVSDVIELPFAHGRLDWPNAAASRPACAAVSTLPTCCRTR